MYVILYINYHGPITAQTTNATDRVTAYNVSVFNSSSGTFIESFIVPVPHNRVDLFSLCSSSPSINIMVSAINRFGEGLHSNVTMIGMF